MDVGETRRLDTSLNIRKLDLEMQRRNANPKGGAAAHRRNGHFGGVTFYKKRGGIERKRKLDAGASSMEY